MTDTQETPQEVASLNYTTVKGTDLRVGDSVQDKGLVVSVEDGEGEAKVIGYGSMRGDEPQIEETVTYTDETVDRAVMRLTDTPSESSGN